MSDRWLPLILKPSLAAAVVFALGMLLMGLPGGIFVELATHFGFTGKLHPDSVWPLAIVVTQAGALMIVPASIVMRLNRPDLVGWRHAIATALVTCGATFIFTIFAAAMFAAR